MSGGRFDYNQYKIRDIAETIQSMIDKNGRKKEKNELDSWNDREYYEKYPNENFFHKYPDKVIEQFNIAVQKLKEAEVYAHRIDWLLSGDDGEENFLKRLKEDLKKI